MESWEWIAAGLGLLNVGLLVLRSVWNYPFGLAMVTLYFFVFLEQRLYSDMLLQIFFFVVQIYGWWSWVRAKQAAGEVQVDLLRGSERVTWAARHRRWSASARVPDGAATPTPPRLISTPPSRG